jgi:hypothetical protein
MKTRKLFLATLLLACAGVQLAFGWGNATHVYFAKELGAKFGFSNMHEMYGCTLDDCFNLVLTQEGQTLAAMMHADAMPVWTVARGPIQKSLAFGFMTHNQQWGADLTAHTKSFAFPSFIDPVTGEPGGYAIEKGWELMPAVQPVLLPMLLAAGIPPDDYVVEGKVVQPGATTLVMLIGPSLGHDLSETAVDLLLKRNIDRAIGVEMMLAAKCRPACAGELLAAAYANALSGYTGTMNPDEAAAFIIESERVYQKSMQQYGMAFSLPEKETIALLSEQTVLVAEAFIGAALVQAGYQNKSVTVRAEDVTALLTAAIDVVKRDYAREISKTLCFIEKGLRQHGIRNGCQLFAHDATEEAVESADLSMAPVTFSLAQNSPNPFNPSTAIAFTLPAQAHVRLTVFNALGQEVATLVDEERPAGSHIARWDAMNQPSGAYFYRIESGSLVETKRMMLVK